MQIAEQQSKVQLQQDITQQQLKDLQATHEKEQHKTQQHFEKIQSNLSGKTFALETALANLHQTFAECVKMSVHTEFLDIQEKLSLMTDTIYNHMLDEMKNVMADGVKGFKAEKRAKKVPTECQMSKESAAEGMTTAHGGSHHESVSGECSGDIVNDYDSNLFVREDKEEILPLKIEEADSTKNVPFISDTVTSSSLKDTLHYELNAFLVNVQKLLLKPISSEDISFHITDRIKGLLQCERNITIDQLLNVQTAISSDVQARLYKMEVHFKQELERIGSFLEQNEQEKLEVDKILEEIGKLKSFLCSELQTRLISHPKKASVSVKKFPMDLGDGEKREGVARLDHTQKPSQSSQLEELGGINYGPDETCDDHTNFHAQNIGSEQVQTMMLMLSMYGLMLLTYYDAFSSRTQVTQKTHKNTEPQLTCEPLESNTAPVNMPTDNDDEHEAFSKHLTDAHLKLMFGQHKEAHFLCDLNYNLLIVDKAVLFHLENIAPGYNLMLQAKILEEKGNLNFYIMSASGKQDDSLMWPANFNITIRLVDKQSSSAGTKKDSWHGFTKSKLLFKPTKSTGRSTPTPICYFREDVINKFIREDTLVFKISVGHFRIQKDTAEEF